MEKALRKGTETFTWFYLKAAFSSDPVTSFRSTWGIVDVGRRSQGGCTEHRGEAEMPVTAWG